MQAISYVSASPGTNRCRMAYVYLSVLGDASTACVLDQVCAYVIWDSPVKHAIGARQLRIAVRMRRVRPR